MYLFDLENNEYSIVDDILSAFLTDTLDDINNSEITVSNCYTVHIFYEWLRKYDIDTVYIEDTHDIIVVSKLKYNERHDDIINFINKEKNNPVINNVYFLSDFIPTKLLNHHYLEYLKEEGLEEGFNKFIRDIRKEYLHLHD